MNFVLCTQRVKILRSVSMSFKKSVSVFVMLNLHFFMETTIPLISHSSFHRIKISYVAKFTIFVVNKVIFCFWQKLEFLLLSFHYFLFILLFSYSFLKYKKNHKYSVEYYVLWLPVRLFLQHKLVYLMLNHR